MGRLLSLVILGLCAAELRADDWPQWLGPQRDGVWRETDILEKFPDEGPRRLWRTPVGGGFSGPVVADGKVVVLDRLRGKDRVRCLDATSGKELWKHEYPAKYEVSYPTGPRATPLVAGGKVYALGTTGHLVCLDAADGRPLWLKDLPDDYKAPTPEWGWSASPLLDGDRLICLVGGAGSTVVAFHKDTGKELWKALTAAAPLTQARYLCKRLRASFPAQKIVVIRWGLPDNAGQRRDELLAVGADLVATTLLDARAQIAPVVPAPAHIEEPMVTVS